jgi:hypothetical protein
MAPRTDTELERYVWRLLPDYVRDDDNGNLETFLGKATLSAMGPTLRIADVADPDTSVTGTAELANPAAAPRTWLRWLGYLVGINLDTIADADKRAAISDSATLQRRGSIRAIIRSTQQTLTGARSCRVYWNLDGSSPYLLTVVTVTAQTPDSVATLAAAVSEKPAGIDLELQTVTGATYAEVALEYADYDAVAAAFTDYDDLGDWTPPTP